MISRRLNIEGLPEVRVFVAQNMDVFTVILEEKINREWHPMVKKEHTIEDGGKFNIEEYLLDVIQEYAKKKKIEEEVGEFIKVYENDDEIKIV